MIMKLTWLELAMLTRERRILSMLLGIALLILASFATVAYDVGRSESARREVAHAERERWLDQGEKDPHSAAHYSIYAFKPAAVLAALDPGIEPYVGQAVWLEAHAQNDLLHRPMGEATVLQRAGLANPAGALIMLAPLAAFVLAFAAIARERERGTLRLSLGAASGTWRIVAPKALAIWSVMLVLFLVPVVLLAAGSAIARGVFDPDAALRLAGWLAMFACYFAVLVFAGLALVIHLADGRRALVALFAGWVLFALALPRGLGSAVEVLEPLPSTQAVKQSLDEEAPSYWSAEVAGVRRAELLERYGVTRVEDLPIDERGAQLDTAERHSHDVFDRVLGGFYDRIEAQDSLFARLSLLSPPAAAQSLSHALAGSDFTHHRRFIDAAESYRRDLVNRMNEEVMKLPRNGAGPHHAGRALWETVPAMTYQPPRLMEAWRVATPAAVALGLWLLAAAVLCVRATRRLQP